MRRQISVVPLMLITLITMSALAQSATGDTPILEISVANKTCSLAEVIAPEATPEPEATPDPATPDYPIITLGDDCDAVIPLLRVPSNGTLWLALSMPDEDAWQHFQPVEDDAYPPQFDRRGRYIGCAISEQGEQVCQVLWTHEDVTYLVEIPVVVGNAFVVSATEAPTALATEEASPAQNAVPSSNGGSTGNPAPTQPPPPPTVPPIPEETPIPEG